jgi:predicted enzyme related to lactoylglutathione lyase
MLRGLATISFYADNLDAARRWYADLLGVDAYYSFPPGNSPAYVEFRIGDYEHELGIIDRRYAPGDGNGRAREPGGAVAFWHVDDVTTALERLQDLGARIHEPVIAREAGFVTASVVDPFGNVLGVMYNPHYLQILQDRGAADALGDASPAGRAATS